MHRLVLPADEVAGCPASCIFPLSPGCVSGLPRTRSLSPEPASESSGCPLVSALRLCQRWTFELPRTSHAFGGAGFSRVPSFPGGSHFLLQRPRCRNLGFPSSCISGFAGDGSSSRPDSRIFRRCRLAGSRVAPSPSRSVSPTIRRPSCPALRILRHRLMDIRVTSDHAPSGLPWFDLRVAPDIFPLATAIDQFPGRPKSWVSRRSPIPRLSSLPESWFLG